MDSDYQMVASVRTKSLSPNYTQITKMKKNICILVLLLSVCLNAHAQPKLKQLEAQAQEDKWLTDPPYTLLEISADGGGTRYNQHGQVTTTNEYGRFSSREPCYFVTDYYSPYAQKLGPQTYMLIGKSFLYSFKENRINPGCGKVTNWDIVPQVSGYGSYKYTYYNFEAPLNFYRRNAQGQKVLKKEKFPEVIQKLFDDKPGYYEKYSPLCKATNLSDPYYVSLLIEALIRYNGKETSQADMLIFSASGFKARSGKSTFRILTDVFGYVSPLEPIIPAGTETDELNYYPQEKRSYSQRYLKQVEATRRIPQNYQGVTFDGEPVLLTDFYGFPAVFDNNKMYYLK